MYIYASSSSVTGGKIPYRGMKKSTVEVWNWWNLYIWTEGSVLFSGEKVHEPYFPQKLD